jgi:hypothetical protein
MPAHHVAGHALSDAPTNALVETQPTENASLLEIDLQEYQALRTQIAALMAFEVQTVNFSIILIGIVASAFTQSGVISFTHRHPLTLLLISQPFNALGVMNIYEKYRIFCTAVYIDTFLRPRLCAQSGVSAALGWEGFLSAVYSISKTLRILSYARVMIFMAPSLAMTALYFALQPPLYSVVDVACIMLAVFSFGAYAFLYRTITYTHMRRIAEMTLKAKRESK